MDIRDILSRVNIPPVSGNKRFHPSKEISEEKLTEAEVIKTFIGKLRAKKAMALGVEMGKMIDDGEIPFDHMKYAVHDVKSHLTQLVYYITSVETKFKSESLNNNTFQSAAMYFGFIEMQIARGVSKHTLWNILDTLNRLLLSMKVYIEFWNSSERTRIEQIFTFYKAFGERSGKRTESLEELQEKGKMLSDDECVKLWDQCKNKLEMLIRHFRFRKAKGKESKAKKRALKTFGYKIQDELILAMNMCLLGQRRQLLSYTTAMGWYCQYVFFTISRRCNTIAIPSIPTCRS